MSTHNICFSWRNKKKFSPNNFSYLELCDPLILKNVREIVNI